MRTPEEFWAQTTEHGACVVWLGATSKGYGSVTWERRSVLAHRLAFFLRMGRWPDGILRHLCGVRSRVLHAVEGTHSENALDRRVHGTDANLNKSSCPRGHAYDDANTYHYSDGRRSCRACSADRERARRAAARAA